MKSVSIIDPLQDRRWGEFVDRHPLGSIFHTAEWATVLMRTFSYKAKYLALDQDGTIVGGLPCMQISSCLTGNRLISLPRTSYCDPLVQDAQDLDLLVDAAIKITKESHLDFMEIKTQKNAVVRSASSLKEYCHFKNQILSLEPGLDVLWKNFDRSCVRQRVSRAEKSGVKIRRGEGHGDLRSFFDLHRQSSRKNGVPHRPFSFFQNMWDVLHGKGLMSLVMAEIGAELGSAAIFLRSKDSLIFEFLGNNYKLINQSPVHLIVWEMIQYAFKEGLRYFDFGLTPPDNAGLISFKSRWGAQDNVLKYYYYPDVTGYKRFVAASPGSGPISKILQHGIVNEIKNSIASRLYRHFG